MAGPIETYVAEELGQDAVDALQRALGPYNDIDHWPSIRDAEHAWRLAYACNEAEQDAIHELTTLRDWLTGCITEITEPSEPQDERVAYGSPWRGDADEVIIALARLAAARNDARPAR